LSQADVEGITDGGSASTPTSVNRQSTLKMEQDEALGNGATISSVLYANMNHPEWKSEFPGKFIPLMS
jgi:histone-lysine N-methyltransferase MLL3